MNEEKGWPPTGIKPYYYDESVCIIHGDCREILPELPKVDLVLTDPPYGYEREGVTGDGKNFLEVVGPALNAAWENLVGGAVCLFSLAPAKLSI